MNRSRRSQAGFFLKRYQSYVHSPQENRIRSMILRYSLAARFLLMLSAILSSSSLYVSSINVSIITVIGFLRVMERSFSLSADTVSISKLMGIIVPLSSLNDSGSNPDLRSDDLKNRVIKLQVCVIKVLNLKLNIEIVYLRCEN